MINTYRAAQSLDIDARFRRHDRKHPVISSVIPAQAGIQEKRGNDQVLQTPLVRRLLANALFPTATLQNPLALRAVPFAKGDF